MSLARELHSLGPGNNVSLVTPVSFGHDQEAIELARADVARQLASVPAMEASGELAPPGD